MNGKAGGLCCALTQSTLRSLADVICSNADYLVNCIGINMRFLDIHPETPIVIQTMLLHANETILPILSDTLFEVGPVHVLRGTPRPKINALPAARE